MKEHLFEIQFSDNAPFLFCWKNNEVIESRRFYANDHKIPIIKIGILGQFFSS